MCHCYLLREMVTDAKESADQYAERRIELYVEYYQKQQNMRKRKRGNETEADEEETVPSMLLHQAEVMSSLYGCSQCHVQYRNHFDVCILAVYKPLLNVQVKIEELQDRLAAAEEELSSTKAHLRNIVEERDDVLKDNTKLQFDYACMRSSHLSQVSNTVTNLPSHSNRVAAHY